MTTTTQFPSIEQDAFDRFLKKFKAGKFKGQRLGQAFYDEFKLYRMTDQAALFNLYAKDGDHAANLIRQIFKLD